jgi:hypothetical protein
MAGLAENLYDDSSKLGIIKSLIGLIITIIIGVILIIIGYTYVFSNNKYIITTGKILEIICKDIISNSSNKQVTQKQCTINIQYLDEQNIEYINTLVVDNVNYTLNQSIQIEYLNTNKNVIRIPGLSDQTMGYISSGISIILILGGVGNYWLTTNYKLYASAQGASTVYNILK